MGHGLCVRHYGWPGFQLFSRGSGVSQGFVTKLMELLERGRSFKRWGLVGGTAVNKDQ